MYSMRFIFENEQKRNESYQTGLNNLSLWYTYIDSVYFEKSGTRERNENF